MLLPQIQHLEIILYRARVLLSAEGSRNYLSFLWWVIDPMMELCIFYVVFGLVLHRGGAGFLAELLTGIFIIRLFISATSTSPLLLIRSEQVLLSVPIPKYIFAAAHTVTCCFKFVFLLLLLCIFLVLLGTPVSPHVLMLVPLTFIYIIFTMGVAMLLSGITPYLPDFAMLYPKITMLLYWGSGVFFTPSDYISTDFLIWFNANPIAGFITAYRDCLLHGTTNFYLVGYLVLVSFFFLVLGYGFLFIFDKKLPRVVAQR
jgi:lipopolysaccharide transport system permease protein